MLDLVAELAGRRLRAGRVAVERHDHERGPPEPAAQPAPTAAAPIATPLHPARPRRPVCPQWPGAAEEALLGVWTELAWRWSRAAGAERDAT